MATKFFSATAGLAVCLSFPAGAAAEQGGGDLRAATRNPISAMYSLPFKFTFDNGADNGDFLFPR